LFKESKLNEDKLNNELLLAKDKYTCTDWNRAAEKSSVEELEIYEVRLNEAESNLNCC
jgi:hypothetical protein